MAGDILSENQAAHFLSSPAPRFLTLDTFEELNIPLLGHQAQIVSEEKGFSKEHGKFEKVTLLITWADG